MPAQRPLVGVLMVMAAVLIFACMDTATKHLSVRYNVPLVVLLRYSVSLILMSAVLAPSHGLDLVRTHRTLLVVLRAASLTISSLCAAFAYQRLPIAEATAVIYLAPFGVLILAGPMLGERVGLPSWIAAATGFAGMMLILRPGGGLEPTGVMFAVTAASINIFYFLLSRMLASTETTVALLYYSLLVGALSYSLMLPWSLHGEAPSLFDALLFVSIGVMGVSGHFLVTAAYREAPASMLAPINYLHIFWAGVLGFIVFGHVPDALGLLGILLIAAAGAGIGVWSHQSSRMPVIGAAAAPAGATSCDPSAEPSDRRP